MNDKQLIEASILYQLKKNDSEWISKNSNGNYNPFILNTLMAGVDFNDEKIHKVEVKESKTHGLGVFATRDINKGELITYYPAHYVMLYPEKGEKYTKVKYGVLGGITVSRKNLAVPENLRDYEFEINSYYSIAGDPRIYDNLTYVGHMINDGARGHSTLDNYNPQDEELYKIVVKAKCNAVLQFEQNGLLSVKVTAIKNIKKGEEILAPYGYEYWKTR